jgi:hypothetical protein
MPTDTPVRSAADRFARKDYDTKPIPPVLSPAPEQEVEAGEIPVEVGPCFTKHRGRHYAFAFELCVSKDLIITVPYSDLRPFSLIARCKLLLEYPGAKVVIHGRNLVPLQVALRDQKLVSVKSLGSDNATFLPDDQTVVTEIILQLEEEEENAVPEEASEET